MQTIKDWAKCLTGIDVTDEELDTIAEQCYATMKSGHIPVKISKQEELLDESDMLMVQDVEEKKDPDPYEVDTEEDEEMQNYAKKRKLQNEEPKRISIPEDDTMY